MLLLIHQLPAKLAYFRVTPWRRLQAIGAVAVKNAIYALPSNAETQEATLAPARLKICVENRRRWLLHERAAPHRHR